MTVKQLDWGKLTAEQRAASIEVKRSESDQKLNITDAITLARSSGLLDATNAVRVALLEGEIEGAIRSTATRWEISANSFEVWLDGALRNQAARQAGCIGLQEARALVREAGIPHASDRLMRALESGEIEDAERFGVAWQIPRQAFMAWLADVIGESSQDGTLTLAEATAEALVAGYKSARPYILSACIRGEIQGARREGSSWIIPAAEFEAWLDRVRSYGTEEDKSESRGIPQWVASLLYAAFVCYLCWLTCPK